MSLPKYINPQRLADLCVNEIIPTMFHSQKRKVDQKRSAQIAQDYQQRAPVLAVPGHGRHYKSIFTLSGGDAVSRAIHNEFHDEAKLSHLKLLMEYRPLIRSVLIDSDIHCLNIERLSDTHFSDFWKTQTGDVGIEDVCHEMLSKLKEKINSRGGHHLTWNHVANAVAHGMTKRISRGIRDLEELGEPSWANVLTAISTKKLKNLSTLEGKYLRKVIHKATDPITLREPRMNSQNDHS